MNSLSITGTDITKRFTGKPIFKPVSFEVGAGEIVAITGPNGAGKSTLLKIIANVLSPTKGSCTWKEVGISWKDDDIRVALGYVAPYLELYDELTAIEQVRFVAELKGSSITIESASDLLTRFGLDSAIARSDRHLRAYSSGMRQRVRCAMAFACAPKALLLDEPTSTLDDVGTVIVLEEAKRAASDGAIVVIATNDAREKAITSREIRIEQY